MRCSAVRCSDMYSTLHRVGCTAAASPLDTCMQKPATTIKGCPASFLPSFVLSQASERELASPDLFPFTVASLRCVEVLHNASGHVL